MQRRSALKKLTLVAGLSGVMSLVPLVASAPSAYAKSAPTPPAITPFSPDSAAQVQADEQALLGKYEAAPTAAAKR